MEKRIDALTTLEKNMEFKFAIGDRVKDKPTGTKGRIIGLCLDIIGLGESERISYQILRDNESGLFHRNENALIRLIKKKKYFDALEMVKALQKGKKVRLRLSPKGEFVKLENGRVVDQNGDPSCISLFPLERVWEILED
jgi:hypothetical protein